MCMAEFDLVRLILDKSTSHGGTTMQRFSRSLSEN